RHGVPHAVGVGSGTDALMLALQAVGVRPGDEVIVPGVSFYSTAGAVRALGAKPVVVDVLPGRPLLDPAAAAAAVGPRTRAIVPVHLYGDLAPLPVVSVPVVEDGAQAVGREPAGALMTLSFYPTKVLGAAGDGGAVLARDAELADRIRALGFHGRTGDGRFHAVSGAAPRNCRLDAVQAAWLHQMLADVPRRVARRREIAARYDAQLGLPRVPRDAKSPVSVYAVRHPGRAVLAAGLARHGIETRVYYPRALGAEPALADLPQPATPNADRFCAETLALPCHAGMTENDVERVIQAVQAES
ncbi:MAG: DegT/DnrJ/EryC1/StrS family aminotransferase, partial [Myxococcota bacterium]|nr:DegT/DnrJ/EryC1/StrS family aminotransferase [Myxococcota bacterium]